MKMALLDKKVSSKVMRAAIIGCGRIAWRNEATSASAAAETHSAAYTLNTSTQLVALVDMDLVHAKACAARYNVKAVYDNVAQMLSEAKPDIVSICVPDEAHAHVLEACLDAPSLRAVWCEKPLATDVAAAERIVAAYQKRGLPLIVNYQRRWEPEMIRIGQAIRKREIGAIQKIAVTYCRGILRNGSHALDLLMDWFDETPERIQAFGTSSLTHKDPTLDARFMLGETVVTVTGLEGTEFDVFEIRIFAQHGRIEVTDFGRRIDWYATAGKSPADRELRTPVKTTQGKPADLSVVLKDVRLAALDPKATRSSGKTALQTLKLCDAIIRAAKKSK